MSPFGSSDTILLEKVVEFVDNINAYAILPCAAIGDFNLKWVASNMNHCKRFDAVRAVTKIYENLIIEIIRMNRTNTKATIASTMHVVDPLLPR